MKRDSKLIVFLGAMISCALWGSAFPAIKVGYKLFQIQSHEVGTQILFAGIRFFLAGVLTIFIGSILEKRILIPKKRSIKKIMILSIFQTILQYSFFYIGLAHTTGVKSSILNSLSVFFAILIACVVMKQEKLTVNKVVGCLLGFVGIIIMNVVGATVDKQFTLLGEGFIIICALAYATSTVLTKKYAVDENPVVLSGYQFLVGSIVMILLGVIMGGKLTTISIQGIVLLAYMGLLSAVAFSVWGILLKYNPVSRVAIYGFLNPMFGVIFSGVFMQGEAQSAFQIKSIVALLFICIGIIIVNLSQKKEFISN